MDETSSSSPPYTYEEIIRVWRPSGDASHGGPVVSAEAVLGWNAAGGNVVHPFGKIAGLLETEAGGLEVTMSIASRPSQSAPGTGARRMFPGGFWLEVTSTESHPLSEAHLEALLHHWMDRRFLTTPLEGSTWDTFRDETTGGFRHQIFLPTTGAAWSADAWRQTLEAILPRGCTSFMNRKASEWSQWSVTGARSSNQFWVDLSSSGEARLGWQEEFPHDTPSSYFEKDDFFRQEPSCPWANRTVYYHSNKQGNIAAWEAELSQVIRRPGPPTEGRLETWFTSSLVEEKAPVPPDCRVEIRQRLPYYLQPSWQSLRVDLVSHPQDEGDLSSDSHQLYTAEVEWNEEDYSSAWKVSTVTGVAMPQSMVVTLDYHPVFLSIDDFPGDPNRGRELPPAVATIRCPTSTTTTTTTTIFSNSLLVLPPVPDMSMPFNVLSLTCSLYAYLVGTIVTLLVRRASERIKYQLQPDAKPPSKFQQLKKKIRTRLSSIFERRRPAEVTRGETTGSSAEGETDNPSHSTPPASEETDLDPKNDKLNLSAPSQ